MPTIINTESSQEEIIASFRKNLDSTWTTKDPQKDTSSDAFTKFCDNIGNLIVKCSNEEGLLIIPDKFIQLKTPNNKNP